MVPDDRSINVYVAFYWCRQTFNPSVNQKPSNFEIKHEKRAFNRTARSAKVGNIEFRNAEVKHLNFVCMICTFGFPQAVKDYGSCCLRYKKNHNFWLTSSYVNISRARSWIKAQNGFIAADSTYLLRHLLPVLIFFVSKWQYKCIHHFFIVHMFTLLSIMSFKAAGLQRIWFSRTFSSGSSRCRQFKN